METKQIHKRDEEIAIPTLTEASDELYKTFFLRIKSLISALVVKYTGNTIKIVLDQSSELQTHQILSMLFLQKFH
jgi:hypothetical protein